MSKFLNLPTLEANFLAPTRVTVDIVGASIDGGRNGLGESIEIEMSGGGMLTSTYEECKIQEPEHFEYINWLGARLNGGFRFINVPIITDWFGPFASKRPSIGGIPHSDGSLHSDGSGFGQGTVYGKVREDAGLNAGVLKIRVYSASRPIRWSDWFSINHDTGKGWRAYRNWDIPTVVASGSEIDSGADRQYQDYDMAITVPLRAAVTAGTRLEFARPLFAAKFKTGFTLPSISEAFYVARQNIQFSEAF